MQSGVPTGMGIRSAKSAMFCSNDVDPTQATVAKLEHVEGNTILQLDQMRRIQPAGGTVDLAPLKTEDVHPPEDSLDITMTEVNLQDIISTPLQDAMTDIMNTSAEDATLEDISDSDVKNGSASIKTVEVKETGGSMDNIKIYQKAAAEMQECVSAPLVDGKVDEIVIVFMYRYNYMVEIIDMNFGNWLIAGQGTMRDALVLPEFYKILGVSSNKEKLQKITGAPENDGRIEEIVETRSENSTGPGMMGRPFNAIEPGDTLNTCMKKLSSVPGHVECNSVSEQEEPDAAIPGRDKLQDAVQTQPEDVVQDGVNAVQNQIFQENAKDPIEKWTLEKNLLLHLLKICLSVVLQR
jgi:hypothetical protein